MTRIVIQGDSVTDAGRMKDERNQLGRGYPMLVAAQLGLEAPGKYEVLNRGVGGDRITGVYDRVKKDITNLEPDVLSILIGVNDVWHELAPSHCGTDTPKFTRVYRMLLEEVLAAVPQVKIMLFAPYVLRGEKTEKYYDAFRAGIEEKETAVRQLAGEFRLPFYTLQDKFDAAAKLAPNEYWVRDGVHPTLNGQMLIASEWLKAFRELSI